MRICIIGAGNLATQLSLALSLKGHQIVQVWSQTAQHASDLAKKLNCPSTNDSEKITDDAQIYLIAIKDEAIVPYLNRHQWGDKLVVHTAGSIPMDAMETNCINFGVFYPFQTFSKNKHVDFDQIPICIEASSPQNLEILNQLACSLSENINFYNSDQRKQIHLAAVFVNNFVNHFYAIGEEILAEKGIGFEILKPLILETAQKIITQDPQSSQTGPAIRNDQIILNNQLEMLNNRPDLKKIYSLISTRIIQTIKH